MAQATANDQPAGATQRNQLTFPDPSITLVEFGESLAILLAAVTERDAENRRIVLKKVGYVRLDAKGWGVALYPEVWVSQTNDGLFFAMDPKTQKSFRYPSRRRYEVAFLSKDLFECAISCLKEKRPQPLMELIAVTFGSRPGFSVEAGCLLAPDDYAGEYSAPFAAGFTDPPPKA